MIEKTEDSEKSSNFLYSGLCDSDLINESNNYLTGIDSDSSENYHYLCKGCFKFPILEFRIGNSILFSCDCGEKELISQKFSII